MSGFETIAVAVAEIGDRYPDHGYTFQDMKGAEARYTFPEIEAATALRAAGIQALGLSPGDRMGLIVIEPEDFVLSFLAALRVGVIPVPLYPPMSMGNLDAYAERTARILSAAGAALLVTSARLQNLLWSQVDRVPSLKRLVATGALTRAEDPPDYPPIAPEDTAFLQYTSGSTADPKGVVITHANLVANVECIILGLDLSPDRDTGVSWLPLYHDMGLIGFVLVTIYRGVNTVFIPTMRFIRRPWSWLDTVHRHRGTISFAPNFAYALAARRCSPEQLETWDLSCVKAFGCGAEPIHPDTLATFTALFSERCGLPPTALLPAYGMAESTLCIAMKPLAERYQLSGEDVACGANFPGHEIAVFSEAGERLGEGAEGEIRVRGPSVSPGYYQDPQRTAETFRGGWLHTGDLGYLRGGQLHVTGRLKDLVILNGRNLHPQSIEWVVAEVPGVRKGNVVAFSRPDRDSEGLVIALETSAEAEAEALDALPASVVAAVSRAHKVAVAELICLPPGALPKTSSGKLQRRKTRQQYLDGTLGTGGSRASDSATDRVTLARHLARSVWTRAKVTIREG